MSNSPVVVVAGVSSGIGRAVATKFSEQGCWVFGTARNLAKTACPQAPSIQACEKRLGLAESAPGVRGHADFVARFLATGSG